MLPWAGIQWETSCGAKLVLRGTHRIHLPDKKDLRSRCRSSRCSRQCELTGCNMSCNYFHSKLVTTASHSFWSWSVKCDLPSLPCLFSTTDWLWWEMIPAKHSCSAHGCSGNNVHQGKAHVSCIACHLPQPVFWLHTVKTSSPPPTSSHLLTSIATSIPVTFSLSNS